MNQRDYRLYLDGRDGDLWRSGVRTWLDEHGDETSGTDSGRPPDPDPATSHKVGK